MESLKKRVLNARAFLFRIFFTLFNEGDDNMKLSKWGCDYQSDCTIRETIGRFDFVGCVYPDDERSYFLDSNIQEKLVQVYCTDGSFFGDLRSARELSGEQEN